MDNETFTGSAAGCAALVVAVVIVVALAVVVFQAVGLMPI